MNSAAVERNRLAAEILAREMEELMDEHFLKPPAENTSVNARLKVLHAKINSYGFLVDRQHRIDVKTLTLKTTITLVVHKEAGG